VKLYLVKDDAPDNVFRALRYNRDTQIAVLKGKLSEFTMVITAEILEKYGYTIVNRDYDEFTFEEFLEHVPE